jgi:hypothetical protein
MPLEFDITQPVNQQKVGHTICVVGSFSGSTGNPFDMSCTISGGSSSGDPAPEYTQTLPGQINFQNETWQCTFSNVPTGIYDISAQVATTHSPAGKSGFGSNPVTEVEVSDDVPIRILGPGAASPPPDGRGGWNKLQTMTVSGINSPGYGFDKGYLVYAHLRLAGQQVSSEGRLTAVWPTPEGSEWQYDLQVPTWALSPATVLIVELWKINQQPQKDQKPVALIAQRVKVDG